MLTKLRDRYLYPVTEVDVDLQSLFVMFSDRSSLLRSHFAEFVTLAVRAENMSQEEGPTVLNHFMQWLAGPRLSVEATDATLTDDEETTGD